MAVIALVNVLVYAAVAVIFRSAWRVFRSVDAARSSITFFAAIAAAAAAVILESPWNASNCRVSDAVEYLVAARRFYDDGRPLLPVQAGLLPSRFPIWFSVLFLSPSYFLLGPELGNPIFVVTAFALIGLCAAFLIGGLLAGAPGGAGAVLLLLIHPGYRYFSKEIMTDVPGAALLLVAALAWLVLRAQERPPFWYAFLGFVVAAGAALRPLLLGAALPFLWLLFARRSSGWRLRAVLFLTPLLILALAEMSYRLVQFSDPWRTGYHFWLSIPYDFSHLTLSASYLTENVRTLVQRTSVIPLGLVLAFVLLCSRRAPVPPRAALFLRFSAFACAPLLCFHLFYFYSSSRFFLPLDALLSVAAGALGMRALIGFAPRFATPLLLLMAFVLPMSRLLNPEPSPLMRLDAETVAAAAPPGSVIITAVNPVYLQEILGDRTERMVVPISRRVEFASKLVMASRPDRELVVPADWRQHRAAVLIEAGAKEAYPLVALEDVEAVKAIAKSGRPVYLDSSRISGLEKESIEREFVLKAAGRTLYSLTPAAPDR